MLKGLPSAKVGGSGPALSSITGLRLFDDSLALPAAIIRGTTLEANARWMASFAAGLGLSLAPHGKTTMSPELFAIQRRHGAWGMTAATAHHARRYAAWGVERILIANQIVGDANLAILADLLARSPRLELYCLCDSVEGAQILSTALVGSAGQNRCRVLVEIGDAGGRGGVRSVESALAVARACHTLPGLVLAGVEVFEGIHSDIAGADAMLDRFAACADAIGAAGLYETEEVVVSAGGSLFFNEAARAMLRVAAGRPTRLVLRSGCYLTHDHGMYARAYAELRDRSVPDLPPGQLSPALEIWAHIQSRPEPCRAIASLGKRDVSSDVDLPVPLFLVRPGRDATLRPIGDISVARLFDQHACLDLPADADLAVGDLIGFGISHPCTTFDKWQLLFLVDGDYRVTGTITTHFG